MDEGKSEVSAPEGPTFSPRFDLLTERYYQVRRDITWILLAEAQRQLDIAKQAEQLGVLDREHPTAQALLTALICTHTAVEAWLNRTLEDEHPVVWPEVDRMEFMAKVRLLAKLMRAMPYAPYLSPYDGTLDPGRQVYDGLLQLNRLRNQFVHYKVARVAIRAEKDPYVALNKLPAILEKISGMSKYGPQIPRSSRTGTD